MTPGSIAHAKVADVNILSHAYCIAARVREGDGFIEDANPLEEQRRKYQGGQVVKAVRSVGDEVVHG
jgi:hypothetical protein